MATGYSVAITRNPVEAKGVNLHDGTLVYGQDVTLNFVDQRLNSVSVKHNKSRTVNVKAHEIKSLFMTSPETRLLFAGLTR